MKYAYSTDGENHRGEYETAEEAIAAGAPYAAGDVCEGEMAGLSVGKVYASAASKFLGSNEAAWLLERLSDNAYEHHDFVTDPFGTDEAGLEALERKLRAVIDEWHREHCEPLPGDVDGVVEIEFTPADTDAESIANALKAWATREGET